MATAKTPEASATGPDRHGQVADPAPVLELGLAHDALGGDRDGVDLRDADHAQSARCEAGIEEVAAHVGVEGLALARHVARQEDVEDRPTSFAERSPVRGSRPSRARRAELLASPGRARRPPARPPARSSTSRSAIRADHGREQQQDEVGGEDAQAGASQARAVSSSHQSSSPSSSSPRHRRRRGGRRRVAAPGWGRAPGPRAAERVGRRGCAARERIGAARSARRRSAARVAGAGTPLLAASARRRASAAALARVGARARPRRAGVTSIGRTAGGIGRAEQQCHRRDRPPTASASSPMPTSTGRPPRASREHDAHVPCGPLSPRARATAARGVSA